MAVILTDDDFSTIVRAVESDGRMQRGPRPVDEPLVARRSYVWIAVVGVVHTVATLGVIAIAEHEYATATARTMGLVAFSLVNLLHSFAARDEERSSSTSSRSPIARPDRDGCFVGCGGGGGADEACSGRPWAWICTSGCCVWERRRSSWWLRRPAGFGRRARRG